MGGDDDETPRYGRQRPGDVGRRAAAMLESERRRAAAQQQRTSNPYGVPVVRPRPERDPDDITSPLDLLLESDLGPGDAPAVERLRRDSADPYEMAWRLAKSLTAQRERERTGSRELEQMLTDSFSGMQQDIRTLKSGAKLIRVVGGAILTLAAGCLLTGLSIFWSRAEREGETTIRLQRLEQDVQELLKELRHPSSAPVWAPHEPPKGQQP